MKPQTKQIIARCGGVRAVAEHFGISVQAVSKWTSIPCQRAEEIKRLASKQSRKADAGVQIVEGKLNHD